MHIVSPSKFTHEIRIIRMQLLSSHYTTTTFTHTQVHRVDDTNKTDRTHVSFLDCTNKRHTHTYTEVPLSLYI